jgi:hypothetical protein
MAVRGSQSNTTLYSLITFVGLFVAATVLAVVFYVKSEEYRTQYETKRNDTERIASSREQAALARIVGKTESGKSSLGTLQGLLDTLYRAVTGQDASEEIPADVKVNDAIMQINTLMQAMGEDASPAVGTEGVSLLNTIKDLKQKLDASRAQMQQLQSVFYALQDSFDDAGVQMQSQQKLFLSELQASQVFANEIRTQFDQLQQQMQSATDEQIQSYRDRLEAEQARLRARQLELQDAEKRMQDTGTLLQDALAKLEAIKPKPDVMVAAYKPDARIVRVDLQNGLVTLDVGAKDHVYRGLTFAIYQSNTPIPEDGQGKAEIEVFQVGEQVSVARILRSDKRNPIVAKDLVVNLIWDPKTSNQFVVVGDFDLNQDGRIDPTGAAQVKELIERWGGRIQDDVTIDTDFIVVGVEPTLVLRPTGDELDADPTALQRYDTARQKAAAYSEQLVKAGRLRVPVFNHKQFMYLIGYDTLATKMSVN